MRNFYFLSCLFLLGAASCSSNSTSPLAGSGAGGAANEANVTTSLTFHKDIEPILQNHCQTCHHEQGVAPFSLLKYEDIKARASLVSDRVTSRTMPPWGAANTNTCQVRFPFEGDLHLSDQQIQTINDWVHGGMPQGDPQAAPGPKAFTNVALEGVTDTLQPEKAYMVKASANDVFRCFVIDPKFTQDTWVNGTYIAPGNPTIVHHVILFSDPDRESPSKVDETGSYQCFGGPEVSNTSFLGGWAPGMPPQDFGQIAALSIPKNSLIVMQVHYHQHTNSDQMDQTKVQLRRVSQAPMYKAIPALIGNADSLDGSKGPFSTKPPYVVKLLPGPDDPPSGPAFIIPANAKRHTESMALTMPSLVPELKIFAVGSHMHWVGNDLQINVSRANPTPDQPAQECLLETPHYDFNWQRVYKYATDVEHLPTVKGGDTIKVDCTYDNTASNPSVLKLMQDQHLSSPKEVRLGEQTTDEMCIGVFAFLQKM